MKSFLILAALLGMATLMSYAQWNQAPEVNGAIYLNNGSELLTPFAYDEKKQVLLKRDSTRLEIFTPFHADSFFYYDPELNWQRRFKKLEYQQKEQFFEVVLPGPLEILRIKLPYDAPNRVITHDLDRHALNYRYFVYHRGELSTLNGYDLKSLRESYPRVWQEAQRYRRTHNFNFYEVSHKMQIIQAVNDLLTTTSQKQLEANRW